LSSTQVTGGFPGGQAGLLPGEKYLQNKSISIDSNEIANASTALLTPDKNGEGKLPRTVGVGDRAAATITCRPNHLRGTTDRLPPRRAGSGGLVENSKMNFSPPLFYGAEPAAHRFLATGSKSR
jgi:hypothetical protein